ncbi:predicted protein [Nematostella vectensis]|uniref:Uncharacterized protein n=1 Tax=Nematostella vectensis TaxID=45351 RepID=A7S0N9_NEMVE|nr:uncharacterized protein LOC5514604 [Nematostella vectensis]EDO42705.1 predicted protein [Nematostella vectensis]|eukprot:XP_001634768.1 predicted protein [Nematostella vectensis]
MGFDCETFFPILKAATTITCGVFVGGAVYINVVEHPARMTLDDTKQCHKQWMESFDRARVFQGRLALSTVLTGAGAYYCNPSKGLSFLIGGCSMAVIFPFTLFVLKPASIDPIYDKEITSKQPEDFVRGTIDKWNKYHAVRSVIAFGVFVGLVSELVHGKPLF